MKIAAVVSKPYDVDQVLDHLHSTGQVNEDIVWIIINTLKERAEAAQIYLQDIKQTNVLRIPSPVLMDSLLSKKVIQDYSIVIEHSTFHKKPSLRLAIIKACHLLIITLVKALIFTPSYIVWIYYYFWYKRRLSILKIDTVFNQSFSSKLLPLLIINSNNLFFYGGGMSSVGWNEEEIFKEKGYLGLIDFTLKNKRTFAMPSFIKNRLLRLEFNKTEYVVNSSLSNDKDSHIYTNISSKFPIDKKSVLIVGSYEKIDEDLNNKIIKLLKLEGLNDYEIEDTKIIYRPHPRRRLNKKELLCLKKSNYLLHYPKISLEVDLNDGTIIGKKIPKFIYIQKSSAALILENILPKGIKLIFDPF